MFSHLFHRRQPEPKFAQGIFFGLVIAFSILAQIKPAVGLAGLGTVAIITAALVELNRERIWSSYKQAYKKRKNLKGPLHEPRDIYYTLNVALLWPLVALTGIFCLWAAYHLS